MFVISATYGVRSRIHLKLFPLCSGGLGLYRGLGQWTVDTIQFCKDSGTRTERIDEGYVIQDLKVLAPKVLEIRPH